MDKYNQDSFSPCNPIHTTGSWCLTAPHQWGSVCRARARHGDAPKPCSNLHYWLYHSCAVKYMAFSWKNWNAEISQQLIQSHWALPYGMHPLVTWK